MRSGWRAWVDLLGIEKVGGWYHVTARGKKRKPIFQNDTDRRHFPGGREKVCPNC